MLSPVKKFGRGEVKNTSPNPLAKLSDKISHSQLHKHDCMIGSMIVFLLRTYNMMERKLSFVFVYSDMYM